MLIVLPFMLAISITTGLALSKLYKKLGLNPGWMVWVPLLQDLELAELARECDLIIRENNEISGAQKWIKASKITIIVFMISYVAFLLCPLTAPVYAIAGIALVPAHIYLRYHVYKAFTANNTTLMTVIDGLTTFVLSGIVPIVLLFVAANSKDLHEKIARVADAE